MKRRTHSLFPLTILALLAVLTAWLDRATRVETPRQDGKQRHDADFIAENFTLRQLDKDGRVLHAMTAQRMLHYPDDESTELFEPRYTYLGRPPPFHVSASRGNISKDGKIVLLTDNVVARQEANQTQPEMTFRTDTLTLYPDEEIARTDAPVTVVRGKSRLTGVGMELDHLNRVLKLHAQVRATLMPQERAGRKS
jgi:lipopolysaccharide export system protein LptC